MLSAVLISRNHSIMRLISFAKNCSIQRSIVFVYGPWKTLTLLSVPVSDESPGRGHDDGIWLRVLRQVLRQCGSSHHTRVRVTFNVRCSVTMERNRILFYDTVTGLHPNAAHVSSCMFM
jgi:hypothetical protein